MASPQARVLHLWCFHFAKLLYGASEIVTCNFRLASTIICTCIHFSSGALINKANFLSPLIELVFNNLSLALCDSPLQLVALATELYILLMGDTSAHTANAQYMHATVNIMF